VHVQVLHQVLAEAVDWADAIQAPRWRVDVDSWRVHAESRFDAATLDGLRALGHDVATTSPFDSGMGHAHAVWRTGGGLGATSDPRSEGAALGL
jgi:gamma-glutamyltranspeptidase/glutathione hydrolase